MSLRNNKTQQHAKHRLEAFSDGVFAIVVTLLVLELTIPEIKNHDSKSELYDAIYSIRNKLISYALSFLFIGQLWVAHTNFFRLIVKTDLTLFWINNLLLMTICLLPFPTMLLGDYSENPGSVIVFGVLFITTGLVFGGMSAYCDVKKYFHLQTDAKSLKTGSIIGSVLPFLSAVPLLLANSNPHLAIALYFLIVVAYIFLQRFFKLKEEEESV